MTAHGSMYDRNYTKLQKLLREKNLDQRTIADEAGASLPTVNRVLNIRAFHKVAYEDVLKVRMVIKERCGGVVDHMFEEYDKHVYLAQVGD